MARQRLARLGQKRSFSLSPASSFSIRLALPISILLHASMITLWSDLHKHTGYGMEARFASHMPSNCTEGTELEVSEKLGIAHCVISMLWQRFKEDGNVSRCYSTGRPRVTTSNDDRYLAVNAKRNRQSTASDLSRQLSSVTGTTVLKQTVYRRLGHIGLYARRPVRCVPLTATHCRLRLTWS
ncbi:transposable element Tcb1 transposase [Trichonephila clavipes]|nr:transposable element Tcb1 transposase [Trichonephila clavipes]